MYRSSLSIFIFFIFSVSISAQCGYVTIDPDGYTNVRKSPSAHSKVLGKISLYHIFSTPDNSCLYDGSLEIEYENPDWLPILINEEPAEAGYIYRPYAQEIVSLPAVKKQMKDSLNASFSDRNINVNVCLTNKFLIKSITISYGKNKSYILPADEIKDVYFLSNPLICPPNMYDQNFCPVNLYKNPNNDVYYLSMSGGDGGDVYSATWIITKEKVHFDGNLGHCSFHNIILDK
ncbi:hypothetical protein [Prevotella sp. 10(H)]|uniref:hypothetical protein n=1 Tax=Prevotella sp. 10(H) TaxID=1158294 RepID=UPI0004A731F5|nr:hypothetical protein [Prevotella sp. 10(H)]